MVLGVICTCRCVFYHGVALQNDEIWRDIPERISRFSANGDGIVIMALLSNMLSRGGTFQIGYVGILHIEDGFQSERCFS
jgi:hypothetical protein